jgi:hypothetical protein
VYGAMTRLRRFSLLGLAPGLLVALTGCPSLSHRIPRSELRVLSEAPPETRGERVRVVQSLGSADEPPQPVPPVRVGVSVYVAAPIWIGGTPRYHRHRAARPGHTSGGRGRFGGRDVAKGAKEEAKAWLVVAAVVAGALALTEGIRYDGWVKLHPMQPVHLWGPYGEYTWMPLAHVTPDVASWADRAVVRENEGPWQPLGRAPLNRRGFTYSLLFGASEVPVFGADPQAGFLGHIQFGYFPVHEIGVQADIAYSWTEDDLGATIFDGRYSLDVSALPLSAGVFSAGFYGQMGIASLSDDGVSFDEVDYLLGGGGLLQLELTTRLALTARAGLLSVHDETLAEFSAGVSIY